MPCPFCLITSAIPPSLAPEIVRSPHGSAYPILSTPTIVGFLDIAPLSRGHVLLCPRTHRTKATELEGLEAATIGFWLPVVSRAVLRAVGAEQFNIIQANGAEAGQTVPHTHFHVIPRGGKESDSRDQKAIGDVERKNLALGEGPRTKLEDKDGTEISEMIKQELGKELDKLQEGGKIGKVGEGVDLLLRMSDGGLKL